MAMMIIMMIMMMMYDDERGETLCSQVLDHPQTRRRQNLFTRRTTVRTTAARAKWNE